MAVVEPLAAGIARGLGPGVYDVHSPQVPTEAEFEELLLAARRWIGPQRLWANPDCGLKTRSEAEVVAALRSLVAAARRVRASAPELV